MRLLPLVALALAAVPSIAFAQKQFEGEVALSLHHEGRVQTMDGFIKGQRMRMNMAMGGQTMGMIADYGSSRVTILMPQMKMYMHQTIPAMDPAGSNTKITKTGERETVAGRRCEVLRIVDENGKTAKVCAATDMGTFVMGGPGARGGPPAWARGMKGFFPLRVSDEKGATVLEVTRIEEKKVDEALFSLPSDFKPMTAPGH